MGYINKFIETSEFFPSIRSWPGKLYTLAHVTSIQNFFQYCFGDRVQRFGLPVLRFL